MDTLPLSEAKDRLSALVEAVETTHETVTITRHGRPAAVLVSVEELESLRETLAWLSDPHHHEEMAEAAEDVMARTEMTLDEVRAKLDEQP